MPDPIPLAALASHVAIVGRTGSGKSYAARGAVERLLGLNHQVVVLDPTGSWWGLRTAADGKEPGLPIPIIGGDHGDAPLPESCGAALARLIVERTLSAVIDTSLFTRAGRGRFYAAFLEELHHRNRDPLHLVVDEADELAPQRPLPDQTMVFHQIDRIIRRGRVRGFRAILITQRPAVLHKDVLSQAGTIVAMNLTAAQDRNAINGWIEGQADRAEAREVLSTLPKLATGEGWVWYPAGGHGPQRRRFPPIATYDSGRTPERGAKPATPAAAATVDVASLLAALAVPEPAATSARADKETSGLRARIADLERQLQDVNETRRRLISAERVIREAAALLVPFAVEDGMLDVQPPQEPAVIDGHADHIPDAGKKVPRAPRATPDLRGKPTPAMRTLRALARIGRPLTGTQWALLAGASAKSSTWRAHLAELRRLGLLAEQGGTFRPSAEGLRALGPLGPPMDAAQVRQHWVDRLGRGPGRLLATLIAAYPRSVPKENLARALDVSLTSSTWRAHLAACRKVGLVVDIAGGLRASPDLFPERADG